MFGKFYRKAAELLSDIQYYNVCMRVSKFDEKLTTREHLYSAAASITVKTASMTCKQVITIEIVLP